MDPRLRGDDEERGVGKPVPLFLIDHMGEAACRLGMRRWRARGMR